MDPSMFPQEHLTYVLRSSPPSLLSFLYSGKAPGSFELLPLLVPTSSSPPPAYLQPSDLSSLLSDLALRFTPSAANDFEGGLEEIIGPLVAQCGSLLVAHKLDIGGGGSGQAPASWREYLNAVQSLAEIKGVADRKSVV